MIRAVLDTNVFISAFIKDDSPPAQIYDAWRRGEFHLITSRYILNELGTIAETKLHYLNETLRLELPKLYQLSEIVEPDFVQIDNVKDNDLPVFGTASAGRADVLVSGDAQILAVHSYRGIRIITPREFLEAL